jgi:hypothetical protein
MSSQSRSKYAKTTTILSALLCFNHKPGYCSNTKEDFSLPYRPIVLASPEATGLLFTHLTSNNKDYPNALEESLFALKLSRMAQAHTPKSRQLFDISSDLVPKDLRRFRVR